MDSINIYYKSDKEVNPHKKNEAISEIFNNRPDFIPQNVQNEAKK